MDSPCMFKVMYFSSGRREIGNYMWEAFTCLYFETTNEKAALRFSLQWTQNFDHINMYMNNLLLASTA